MAASPAEARFALEKARRVPDLTVTASLRHARETGVETKARTFSVLSHLSAMLFAQLTHAMGLNDVCDWLRLKAAAISRFGVE